MKNLKFLAAGLILACSLVLTAGAATEFAANTDGSFTVSYPGTANEYYAIVAVEGIAAEGDAISLTEDSIQYIDQQTATASGVTFDKVLIKDDGTPCTVYIGGSDLSKAVLLGYFNKTTAPDTFTVSGTVTSASAIEANVDLTSASGKFSVKTVNGEYSIEVPADTYQFVVTKKAHLSYTKNELVVSEDTVKDVAIKGGDVVENGVVDYDDLSSVILNYSTSTANGDTNGDGVINYDDLSTIILNYLATAVVE